MSLLFEGVRRLSESTSTQTGLSDIVSAQDHSSGHGGHDKNTAFEHVYFLMVFMALLWFVGKLCAKLGMPALVGEILVGVLYGPNLLEFAPIHEALIIVGEVGLVMLVLEAGIDVDIGMLKIIGLRGLGVALFGSMVPLLMGTALALAYGETFKSSISIAACFAPTSMGIALNVLKTAKVLDTPTGQLIIAAAVLDDVIALMLLSELEAMKNPTFINIMLPLVVSPVLICFFGYLAIKYVPKWLKKVMKYVHPSQQENAILFFLFIATFILVPGCFYAGSSHLLGAFLAGLMFCTDHTIHHAWIHQIKRVLQWMLRVFFSATIGFAVPIKDFWSSKVILGTLLYMVSILGKLATGFFATPLNWKNALTISFSMSAWGEFAFILATANFESGTISKDAFSSVLMAVLISVIVSPYGLRLTLTYYKNKKNELLSNARSNRNKNEKHPVYFCIHCKARGTWGHQDRLLKKIYKLKLEVIDFRAWHAPETNLTAHLPLVEDVFYVLDPKLKLPPSKHLNENEKNKLKQRFSYLKESIQEAIQSPKSKVTIMRWIPGINKDFDNDKETDKVVQSPEYCRQSAYKQAQLALDSQESHIVRKRHRNSMSSLWGSGRRLSRTESIRGIDINGKTRLSIRGDMFDNGDDMLPMQSLRNLREKINKSIESDGDGSTDLKTTLKQVDQMILNSMRDKSTDVGPNEMSFSTSSDLDDDKNNNNNNDDIEYMYGNEDPKHHLIDINLKEIKSEQKEDKEQKEKIEQKEQKEQKSNLIITLQYESPLEWFCSSNGFKKYYLILKNDLALETLKSLFELDSDDLDEVCDVLINKNLMDQSNKQEFISSIKKEKEREEENELDGWCIKKSLEHVYFGILKLHNIDSFDKLLEMTEDQIKDILNNDSYACKLILDEKNKNPENQLHEWCIKNKYRKIYKVLNLKHELTLFSQLLELDDDEINEVVNDLEMLNEKEKIKFKKTIRIENNLITSKDLKQWCSKNGMDGYYLKMIDDGNLKSLKNLWEIYNNQNSLKEIKELCKKIRMPIGKRKAFYGLVSKINFKNEEKKEEI